MRKCGIGPSIPFTFMTPLWLLISNAIGRQQAPPEKMMVRLGADGSG